MMGPRMVMKKVMNSSSFSDLLLGSGYMLPALFFFETSLQEVILYIL